MIRVLLVDDHHLVRAGLVSLLASAGDVEVVGEAADGAAALEAAASTPIDLVLMDLSMPVLDGVAATKLFSEQHPDVRVVVLSSFSDQARVREAIAAGAAGYVLKDTGPDELLLAVRSAASGPTPLDPRVAGALLPARAGDGVPQLSTRELEVLRLASKGLANKQIERTVKDHLPAVE